MVNPNFILIMMKAFVTAAILVFVGIFIRFVSAIAIIKYGWFQGKYYGKKVCIISIASHKIDKYPGLTWRHAGLILLVLYYQHFTLQLFIMPCDVM